MDEATNTKTEFDPYDDWLDIGPDQQPADRYQLLGVERYEDDEDVIRDASSERLAHLRSLDTGEHAPLRDELVEEVVAAQKCLLNDKRRDAYAHSLRAKLQPKKRSAPAPRQKPSANRPAPSSRTEKEEAAKPVAKSGTKKKSKSGSGSDSPFSIDAGDTSFSASRRSGSSAASRSGPASSTHGRSSVASQRVDSEPSARAKKKQQQQWMIIGGIAGGLLLVVILVAVIASSGGTPEKNTTAKKKKKRNSTGYRSHVPMSARKHHKKRLNTGGKAAFEDVMKVADLMEDLQKGDPSKRAQACRELGKLGGHARGALATLRKLAQDTNSEVASAAADAVKKIEAGEKKLYKTHERIGG